MKEKILQRNLSQIYLTAVPVLTTVFGLGVGYISYKIYVPIWIINVLLMILFETDVPESFAAQAGGIDRNPCPTPG